MPRSARKAPGEMVFHVINRGVGRRKLFLKEQDYAAFEGILEEVLELVPTRLLAYCLMPNHWHLVLWPRRDGELARFMQRMTITHASRWQRHYDEAGYGHVYQGRFKSFPVQRDEHFLSVCRYVERNPLRSGLVRRAENWRWSSLWRRERVTDEQKRLLSDWPVRRPADWLPLVNRPQTDAELAELRESIARGRPFGSPQWRRATVGKLGLESSIRPRGRPRKHPAANRRA